MSTLTLETGFFPLMLVTAFSVIVSKVKSGNAKVKSKDVVYSRRTEEYKDLTDYIFLKIHYATFRELMGVTELLIFLYKWRIKRKIIGSIFKYSQRQ
jgi:hypothetical protein